MELELGKPIGLETKLRAASAGREAGNGVVEDIPGQKVLREGQRSEPWETHLGIR